MALSLFAIKAQKYLLDVILTLPLDYRNPSERWKL